MKFNKIPNGVCRTVQKFLFFPTRLPILRSGYDGINRIGILYETRWLEFAWVKQVSSTRSWTNICFADYKESDGIDEIDFKNIFREREPNYDKG